MGFIRSIIFRLFKQSSVKPAGSTNLPDAGFAIIDLETTGLSPKRDRILEIAIVQADHQGRGMTEWTTRINPQGPVGATHIHGITQQDVEHAPTFAEVAPFIIQQLRGRAIVAHNASFDLAFLQNELFRAGWDWPEVPFLCTLKTARNLLPPQPKYTLSNCCLCLGIPHVSAHSALGDARATTELLHQFFNPRVGGSAAKSFADLPLRAREVNWPLEPQRSPQQTEDVQQTKSTGRHQRFTTRKTTPEITSLLHEIESSNVLSHTTSPNAAPYVEVLLSSLADGELSESELQALGELQQVNLLSDTEVESIHRAVAAAIADLAVKDDIFSKRERDELKQILGLLGIPESQAIKFFREAQARRYKHLSVGLPPLPADWHLDAPLRVGDRVVFTGIDDSIRIEFEEKAKIAGIYIGNSVAKNTTLLVTDGSYKGQKYEKALDLGTRMVSPSEFKTLLKWIQPYE